MAETKRGARKLSKAERDWIASYKKRTGIEPTLDTDKPFLEFAERNIEWLREHMNDMARQLEKDLYDIKAAREDKRP